MARKRSAPTLAKAMSKTDRPIWDGQLPEPMGTGRRVNVTDAQVADAQAQGFDSLRNFLAGLNTSRDKRSHAHYDISPIKNNFELENLYEGSWLAARIVSTPAEDMTREWIDYRWEDSDDEEDSIRALREAEMQFDVKQKINDALMWARLYGGAVLIPMLKGQENLGIPINLDRIRKGDLLGFHVLDRWRIAPTGDIDYDFTSPNFGLPREYVIAEAGNNVPNVHWSRVIRFNGRKLPYFRWRRNGMWDASELAHILDNIRDYDATKANIASLVYEANLNVMSATGLMQKLSTDLGTKEVLKRYLMLAEMKSNNRMIVLDKEKESFEQRQQTTFSGLNEVLMRFMIDVCGAADIPTTRLFGQSPAGLTATGESDIRNYYDHISSKQETQLRPQVQKVMEILLRSTFGSMPTNFEFEFKPLWQMSDAERATAENTRATMDVAYVNAGIIPEAVVARELMERGTYKTLEDKDVQMVEDMAEQNKELAVQAARKVNVMDPESEAAKTKSQQTTAADSRVGDMIRKDADGWNVYLGDADGVSKKSAGPFPKRAVAERELRMAEYLDGRRR